MQCQTRLEEEDTKHGVLFNFWFGFRWIFFSCSYTCLFSLLNLYYLQNTSVLRDMIQTACSLTFDVQSISAMHVS